MAFNQEKLRQELEALKLRNQQSLGKDEALQLAIQAAELSMKFIETAKTPQERRETRQAGAQMIAQAEKIRHSPAWKPHSEISLLDLEPLEMRSPQLKASVVGTLVPKTKAPTSKDIRNESGTDSTPTWTSSAVPSMSSTVTSNPATVDTVLRSQPRNAPAVVPPQETATGIDVSEVTTREAPQSMRELTQHEQLVIARGSKINNAVFQPWVAPPPPATFELVPKAQLFRQEAILESWIRVSEVFSTTSHYPPLVGVGEGRLAMARATPRDLVQDAATDCSFVASLSAAAARNDKGHSSILVSNLFPYDSEHDSPQFSENGKYIARLYFNGAWRRVVVDDLLPQAVNGRSLYVVDRADPTLIWPAILEKAYLKVQGGYDFPGSNSGTDLFMLTGWIPEQKFLQHDEMNTEKLWTTIQEGYNAGNLIITIGTGVMTTTMETETGLAGEHDYAILDVVATKGERKLLIKNPWVNGPVWREYNRRMDTLIETDETEETTDSPTTDDRHGVFWMKFDAVVQNFATAYLNWNPALFRFREDMHFAWDLTSGSKKIRSPPGSFHGNPQCVLKSEEGARVWLLLSKHFGNYAEAPTSSSQYISIWVYRGDHRVESAKGAKIEGSFTDSPQTLVKLKAKPGSSYVVVTCEQDLWSVNHSFTLSAFADNPVSLSTAPSAFQHSTTALGEWTQYSSGGNQDLQDYYNNPQFSLQLQSPTTLSLVLENLDNRTQIHFKLLRCSQTALRSQELWQRDIVTTSGKHKRHCAFAEVVEPIDSGTYLVICNTYMPMKTGRFALHLSSNVPAVLTPLPREGAGRLRFELAAAPFGRDVRRVAAPVIVSRLCRIQLTAKAQPTVVPPSKSTSSSNSGDDNHTWNDPRSGMTTPSGPVRVSIEQGYGVHRTILIASAGGTFRDIARGVQTDDIDLQPQAQAISTVRKPPLQAGKGDMWIVVERMSTGKPEMVYMEYHSDTPEPPLKVGVWRDADHWV